MPKYFSKLGMLLVKLSIVTAVRDSKVISVGLEVLLRIYLVY